MPGGGIGRIEQDRHRCLHQPLCVAQDRRKFRCKISSDVQSSKALVVLQQFKRALEHGIHVGGCRRRPAAPGPGKIEQSLDDTGTAPHFALDDLKVLLDGG